MPEITDLSERELEILGLVATGASNKEIAQELHISANTVKVHLRNIFAKIEVSSRTEAAMFAVGSGLVEGISAPLDDEAAEAAGNGRPAAAEPAAPAPVAPVTWLLGGGLALILILAAVLFWTRGQNPAVADPGAAAVPGPAGLIDAARWQTRAALPSARAGLALAVYEGRVYALAGESAGGVSDAAERYDPQADAWLPLADKPTPVSDVSAVVLGGEFYVPGGRLESGAAADVLEIFDPDAGAWRTAAPLPAPRSAYALAAFEGKLYLFGGWEGEKYTDTTFQYSPESDRWEENTPLPGARGYAGAVVANGRIFVMGGYDGEQALDENLLYAPENEGGQDSWQPQADLPQGRYAMGVATLADHIYLIGGLGADDAPLPRLEYTPAADRWDSYESGQAASWSHGGLATIGTELHLLGGREGDTLSPLHLAFQAIYLINMPAIIQE